MESENRIRGVNAIDVLTGERFCYDAKLFIDAKGDGWVGFFAGDASARIFEVRAYEEQ